MAKIKFGAFAVWKLYIVINVHSNQASLLHALLHWLKKFTSFSSDYLITFHFDHSKEDRILPKSSCWVWFWTCFTQNV